MQISNDCSQFNENGRIPDLVELARVTARNSAKINTLSEQINNGNTGTSNSGAESSTTTIEYANNELTEIFGYKVGMRILDNNDWYNDDTLYRYASFDPILRVIYPNGDYVIIFWNNGRDHSDKSIVFTYEGIIVSDVQYKIVGGVSLVPYMDSYGDPLFAAVHQNHITKTYLRGGSESYPELDYEFSLLHRVQLDNYFPNYFANYVYGQHSSEYTLSTDFFIPICKDCIIELPSGAIVGAITGYSYDTRPYSPIHCAEIKTQVVFDDNQQFLDEHQICTVNSNPCMIMYVINNSHGDVVCAPIYDYMNENFMIIPSYFDLDIYCPIFGFDRYVNLNEECQLLLAHSDEWLHNYLVCKYLPVFTTFTVTDEDTISSYHQYYPSISSELIKKNMYIVVQCSNAGDAVLYLASNDDYVDYDDEDAVNNLTYTVIKDAWVSQGKYAKDGSVSIDDPTDYCIMIENNTLNTYPSNFIDASIILLGKYLQTQGVVSVRFAKHNYLNSMPDTFKPTLFNGGYERSNVDMGYDKDGYTYEYDIVPKLSAFDKSHIVLMGDDIPEVAENSGGKDIK